MKKLLSIVISVIFIFSAFSFTAGATTVQDQSQNRVVSETVEYFEDGSCAVITICEDILPQSRASTYTKSGSKTYTAKNSDGDVLWKFKVNGTFSVNSGVSATCTSSSYSTSNLASGWSLKTATASRSGNKAIADGTFQKKVLLIVTRTEECRVTLQCDSNGNLS